MTSSISAARIDLCELSPITQRSASTRFDLPQPFGPTTPARAASIRKSVGSTKVLKPTTRRRLSFMRANPPLPAARGEGLAREREASEAQRSGGEGAFQDGAHRDTPPHPPPDHSPGVLLSPHAGRGGRCAYAPSIGLMIFSISSIDRLPPCRWPLMKKVGVALTLNCSSARFRTAFTASYSFWSRKQASNFSCEMPACFSICCRASSGLSTKAQLRCVSKRRSVIGKYFD